MAFRRVEMTQVTEIKEITRAQPAGSCIYCGDTNDLRAEHIIPLALQGNYILPEASCSKCEATTSAFEGRVLRGFFLDARTVAGYRTRHPKNRPTILPLGVERDGIIEEINLRPVEHPGFLYLPILTPPTALAGEKEVEGASVHGAEILYFGKHPADVAKTLNVKTIQRKVNWDITSFARFLAKIAYAYAVASVGTLPRVHVPILPLILGTADDASRWIGSAQFKLSVESKNPLHALGHTWVVDPNDSGSEFLLVRVKLFVPSGATGYEIIVCRKALSEG